jgi:transposase
MTGDRRMPSEKHSASGFDRIKVVTGSKVVGRGSLGEKLKAVEETRSSGLGIVGISRRNNAVLLSGCMLADDNLATR